MKEWKHERCIQTAESCQLATFNSGWKILCSARNNQQWFSLERASPLSNMELSESCTAPLSATASAMRSEWVFHIAADCTTSVRIACPWNLASQSPSYPSYTYTFNYRWVYDIYQPQLWLNSTQLSRTQLKLARNWFLCRVISLIFIVIYSETHVLFILSRSYYMFDTLLLFSGIYTSTKADSGLGCTSFRLGGASYCPLWWVPHYYLSIYAAGSSAIFARLESCRLAGMLLLAARTPKFIPSREFCCYDSF